MSNAMRLHPAPGRFPDENPHVYGVPAGMVTIDQYLALRAVSEHRRAARRALAGELRVATVEAFDRLFRSNR